MKRIILIGAGNVAHHLGLSLFGAGHQIIQVISKTQNSAKCLAEKLNTEFEIDIAKIRKADFVIIAVNDDTVAAVASQIKNMPFAHTSGSVCLKNGGVFYPLQTFNTDIKLTISDIQFCIEANSKAFENQLVEIAKNLSSNVITMNVAQRKQLHIAAVFACNFSNQMYSIADNLLAEKDIDFKILLPLIKQTIAKLNTNKPKAVQTGPAKRKDLQTIKNQINLLEDDDLRNIYKLITNQILRQK